MLLVKIKHFNTLIHNETFFGHLVKNKQEAYKILIDILRYVDYTTGNLLDITYHQN